MSGLKKLRDYLWLEFDQGAPRVYTTVARWLEGLKSWFELRASPNRGGGDFGVSIAEPDKLGTADVSVKDDVAKWLMHNKKAAVAVLGEHIRDEHRPEHERRHAARTLELISGRRLHHDGKIDEADALLKLHRA